MKPAELVAGLTEERERLAGFVQSLAPEAWDRPSACDGWTIRDVVAHLIGNVADTLGGRLADFGSETFNQRQVDERAGKTPAELLGEWSEIGPKMETLFGGLPEEFWDREIAEIGMSTREGIQRLLEDLWIHASDIRLPLGVDPEPGPGMHAALGIIALEIPRRFPALAPGAGTVRLDLDGFDTRIDLDGDTPVLVTGDPIAFVLVATGRLALSSAIVRGRLAVDTRPEGLERALNIYGVPLPVAAASAAE